MRNIAISYSHKPTWGNVKMAILEMLIDGKKPEEISKRKIHEIIRLNLELYGIQGIEAWVDLFPPNDLDLYYNQAVEIGKRLYPD